MSKHSTANPALPTAAANIPCMKPKRKEDRAKQKEMLDELLKQVIEEAKSFRRPKEHGEK